MLSTFAAPAAPVLRFTVAPAVPALVTLTVVAAPGTPALQLPAENQSPVPAPFVQVVCAELDSAVATPARAVPANMSARRTRWFIPWSRGSKSTPRQRP